MRGLLSAAALAATLLAPVAYHVAMRLYLTREDEGEAGEEAWDRYVEEATAYNESKRSKPRPRTELEDVERYNWGQE